MQHLRVPHGKDFVSFNTTHHAYENLIFNRNTWQPDVSAPTVLLTDAATQTDSVRASVRLEGTDLFIGTAPSQEERQLAADNGVGLVIQPVCWDAFVFVTYANNPVESLTLEQIRDIYAGNITNWNQVGGVNQPIRAYTRNANSGSQTAMEELVMKETPFAQDRPLEDTVNEMSTLLEAIAWEDAYAIGYSYHTFLSQETGRLQPPYPTLAGDVKTIAIEGVMPNSRSIADGTYPLSVNYVGVIRQGDEQRRGGLFLDWMRSAQGQDCIRQAGYIPLDGSQAKSLFDSEGFVFPDSDTRRLTRADFDRLAQQAQSDAEVRELLGFARNEIFARHGHIFKSAIYSDHFGKYEWYHALPRGTVMLDDLSAIEQDNVRLIRSWEDE
jgi:phosphate transport system substrate-binding protein